MKNYLFILGFSALLIDCTSITDTTKDTTVCNCDDLQLDIPYNHFYIENRKEPYTGVCFKLNKNRDTIETINYNKGKVEGTLTKYYNSGQKQSEITFKKNKYHGDYRTWDEKGNLIFHCKYVKGSFDTVLVDRR